MPTPSYATINESTNFVPVAEMRDAIYAVNRCLNVHRHACVGKKERAGFVESLKRTARRLSDTASKRAKDSDWRERERALDASADFIVAADSWIQAAE